MAYDFKILVKETCSHCNGEGSYEGENEFEEKETIRCFFCEGKKEVERWIGIEEFAKKLSVVLYGNESIEDVHASEAGTTGNNGSSAP